MLRENLNHNQNKTQGGILGRIFFGDYHDISPKKYQANYANYPHPMMAIILLIPKCLPHTDGNYAHPIMMMILLTPAAKAAKSTAFPPEMIEVEEALVQD